MRSSVLSLLVVAVLACVTYGLIRVVVSGIGASQGVEWPAGELEAILEPPAVGTKLALEPKSRHLLESLGGQVWIVTVPACSSCSRGAFDPTKVKPASRNRVILAYDRSESAVKKDGVLPAGFHYLFDPKQEYLPTGMYVGSPQAAFVDSLGTVIVSKGIDPELTQVVSKGYP